jgi:hypothetical protein
MPDAHPVHQEESEAEYVGPWQQAGRKKGKGRAESSASQVTPTPSATPMSFSPSAGFGPTPIQSMGFGPSRRGRDRSPRRPSAAGTPAQGSESGIMLQSKLSEDVEQVPYVTPSPSAAASSGTRQQAEEAEEAPYMPPMLEDAEQIHNTADDETPYLDSLPSTPRAGSAGRETVTATSGVAAGASMERVAADAAEHPPVAAAQPASAAEQHASTAQPPGHTESNQRGGGPQPI